MSKFNTPITKLLDVELPIILPPMAFAGTPALTSEVTKSGGFAFLGAGFDDPTSLRSQLAEVRKSLSLPADSPVPVGVGFIGWILDRTEATNEPRIPAVLQERPKAIWFASGTDLGKYIAQVRDFDAARDHKTIIIATVNNVEEALQAANDWKVDVIAVQGIEAGGHGGGYAPSLFNLLPAVREALPDGPPLIAAGGISNGAQIASLLLLGAAGAVLGTRFLATNECSYTSQQKEILIQSDIDSTIRTLAFDEVFKTSFWPPGYNGRAVSNKIIEDVKEGLSLDDRLKRYEESASSGDTSRTIVWAGAGVGSIKKIEPAKDVVTSLRQELIDAVANARALAPV